MKRYRLKATKQGTVGRLSFVRNGNLVTLRPNEVREVPAAIAREYAHKLDEVPDEPEPTPEPEPEAAG